MPRMSIVRILTPVHSQQNAQLVWSSPLTVIRVAGCVGVIAGVPAHNVATTNAPLFVATLLTRKQEDRCDDTVCMHEEKLSY
jgi:hypothetical protein